MSQNLGNVIAGLYEPYDYEDLTVDSTAGGVALDSTKVKNKANPIKECQRVILTLETAAVRYRTDGGAPTTTVGHLLGSGDILTLQGQPTIDRFRAIRTTGTSGVFRATFER